MHAASSAKLFPIDYGETCGIKMMTLTNVENSCALKFLQRMKVFIWEQKGEEIL